MVREFTVLTCLTMQAASCRRRYVCMSSAVASCTQLRDVAEGSRDLIIGAGRRTRYLVAKGDVEGFEAASRRCRVNHVVVQQTGHMYELRDLQARRAKRIDGMRCYQTGHELCRATPQPGRVPSLHGSRCADEASRFRFLRWHQPPACRSCQVQHVRFRQSIDACLPSRMQPRRRQTHLCNALLSPPVLGDVRRRRPHVHRQRGGRRHRRRQRRSHQQQDGRP